MKILHFITSLRTGGAERLVTDLMPRLKAEGHQVSVLLMDGTMTPLYEELSAAGVPVSALSCGWKAMRNPLLIFRLIAFLRRGRYDIVHTHNTSCQLLTAVASVFVPVKLVTTEHNTSNKRRNWKWYKPLDNWMYSRYKHVICVGEETKNALLSHFHGLSTKVSVVLNGIDTFKFTSASPAPDLISVKGRRIIMVAAFREQKDHPTLIKAMKLLPDDYKLLLAGGSETDADRLYLEQCRTLVSDLELDRRVLFLGVRNDVPQVLAAADVVILSTHYEGGTSLSGLEAMAMGKPFIASDVDGVRSMVEDAGALFTCGDSAKLSSLIRRSCEDPDFARTIGAACRERAAQYDISRTIQGYLEIYSQLN